MRKLLLLKWLLAILFALPAYAQLPSFTVSVTATPETCPGNGALSFTVIGTNPAATMAYAVYLLPNTTTPVTIVNSNSATSLSAGNYMVVATQSLGTEFNTASATVTLTDTYEPLEYVLVGENVWCPSDGVITANVTSGNAVSYEIISGPVTAPLQSSNVFSGLPPGTYVVRAYDSCGEAMVVTVQLLQINTQVVITDAQLDNAELPSCDTFEVRGAYYTTPGHEIFWPLTYEYTVYPPGGGAPQVVTSIYPTGSNIQPNPTADILPFYNDQEYYYDLAVTDACGNVYEVDHTVVNRHLLYAIYIENENCEAVFFDIRPGFYVGPYTIDFLAAPAGFVPASFNSSFPTFTGNAQFGGQGNPVPYGTYTAQITDACGRTWTETYDVLDPELVPIVGLENFGCGGNIRIEVPLRHIESVSLDSAPATYTTALPLDVSNLIDPQGVFYITSLPPGTYVFSLLDSCGDTYIVEREIEELATIPDLVVTQRPGCDIGYGSILLAEGIVGGSLVNVVITDAPDSYPEALPYDVSFNVAGGAFYMNSFPQGDYVFEVTNNCGLVRTFPLTIQGHQFAVNDVDIIPHCGSFDINLHHTSNGNNLQSFWLQKYDPVSGTWGHPLTGVPYPEGTQPVNNLNSIYIVNNQMNINFGYTGQFRVIKIFFSISNGSGTLNRCLTVLKEFTFGDGPVITGAYSAVCSGGLAEVIIEAEGVPPLSYSITEKDGDPFMVDNGTSGVFSGLEPGVYNFRITDVCGNIRNVAYDINALDPVSIIPNGFCEGEDSSLSVQEFPFLTYEWWEEGSPGTILGTTNVLLFPSFSAADAGTYYVKLTSANPNSCANQLLQYTIQANAVPNAGQDNTISVCRGAGAIDLQSLLTTPHDPGGTWNDVNSTGGLSGSMLDVPGLAAGNYQFDYTVSGICNATDTATIRIEVIAVPDAPVISPVQPVCEGSTIQLTANEVPGVSYEWTGPGGFSSSEHNPLIINATSANEGIYMLKFTNAGCDSAVSTVIVMLSPVPQFTVEGNTTFCSGQSSVLTVVPANFDNNEVTYEWYHNGDMLEDVNGFQAEVFEEGLYKVLVASGGCEASQEVTVTHQSFEIALTAGCHNNRYMLEVENPGGAEDADVVWSGPDGFYGTGKTVDITGKMPGEYSAEVTNAEGCSAQAALMVEAAFCGVPRGISPNNDGLNDEFDLSYLGVNEIIIFNRYGLEVYKKENYKNEWHGQSDKGDLPGGTYYYRLTLSGGDYVTGWVYLQKEY